MNRPRDGLFPSRYSWPSCIRNQNSRPKPNRLAPPVAFFSQVLDPPRPMVMPKHWMKPGKNIEAARGNGGLIGIISPMPSILLLGTAISAIPFAVSLPMTPITSTSLITRGTMDLIEEPTAIRNGWSRLPGKSRAGRTAMKVNLLPVKANSKDLGPVASGLFTNNFKEPGVRIQETKGIKNIIDPDSVLLALLTTVYCLLSPNYCLFQNFS